MDPFAALADPTRRRILELLVVGECAAGDLTEQIRAESGLSQPTVSQHLASLRAADLVTVRVDGPRRMYSTVSATLGVVAAWVDHVTPTLEPALDALATEVARGKRQRRASSTSTAHEASQAAPPQPGREGRPEHEAS